jgi:hypothetical protein
LADPTISTLGEDDEDMGEGTDALMVLMFNENEDERGSSASDIVENRVKE